jgi:hypothetical protein
MSRFTRFVGSRRRLIACLGLLLGAGTGCTGTRRRAAPPEMISNEDAAQIQPVVHSHSFTMRNIDATRQLTAGIYAVENNKWRWTAGDFSIVLATPRMAAAHGANLAFAFDIPDAILRRTGPITLAAYLNGTEVGMATYPTAGAQRFSAMIPPELLRESPVAINFRLNRCVPKGVLDSRELGFVAESISLETNENR